MHVIVIGGGLSGLATAAAVVRAGERVTLLEARDRLGGRILSAEAAGGRVELGPAWIWPGQARAAQLAEAAGSDLLTQYSGALVLWSQGRGPPRRVPFDVHMGAVRVAEGLASWIDHLRAALPDEAVRLGAEVTRLGRSEDTVTATLADGSTIAGTHAVLAMPPRLMARLEVDLPVAVQRFLPTVSTWMAGEAKVVAVYDEPFWRAQGLSGDGLGGAGPLQQIYDASGPGFGALGGFVGPDARARAELGLGGLKAAAVEQLAALFGPEAEAPRVVLAHDWWPDRFTAVEADAHRPDGHPDYRAPFDLGLWDGRLVLSGTELASSFGGYLEGALVASADAITRLGLG